MIFEFVLSNWVIWTMQRWKRELGLDSDEGSNKLEEECGQKLWGLVMELEFDFMDHVLSCYWLFLICDVMCLDWPICCVCVRC